MSRIGKTIIIVPSSVTVQTSSNTVEIKGPKGEASIFLPAGISLKQENNQIIVDNAFTGTKNNALHGLVRATIANYIVGVTDMWTKTLEMVGVGYRASMQGTDIVLNVGFSHPVTITPPDGITFAVKEGKIVVTGVDKQMVGKISADIRSIKPPEPYKGKGIKYSGEHIRRKAGKAAKAVGGAK